MISNSKRHPGDLWVWFIGFGVCIHNLLGTLWMINNSLRIMAGKRKRRPHSRQNEGDRKRQRIPTSSGSKHPTIKQAVLAQYYPHVLPLREYLLSKLPSTSKVRRKKIKSIGLNHVGDDHAFAEFLDGTLIGVSKYQDVSQDERMKQWISFSQRATLSTSTVIHTGNTEIYSQSEVSV